MLSSTRKGAVGAMACAAAVLILATAARSDEKVASPAVRNIAQVTDASGPSLLHFTAEQWKTATQDAVRVYARPRAAAWLEFAPIPGQPGAVLAAPMCRRNPLAPQYAYQAELKVAPGGASKGIDIGCSLAAGVEKDAAADPIINSPCRLRWQGAAQCATQHCAGGCRLELFLDDETYTGRLACTCLPPEGAHPPEYRHNVGGSTGE